MGFPLLDCLAPTSMQLQRHPGPVLRSCMIITLTTGTIYLPLSAHGDHSAAVMGVHPQLPT